MVPYFYEKHGNAASRSHQFGWEAEDAVDYAREQIAKLLDVEDKEVIFTSGATESNNLALKGVFEMYAKKATTSSPPKRSTKPSSTPANTLKKQGAEITYLKVQEDGLINLADLEAAIKPTTIWCRSCGPTTRPGDPTHAEIAQICEKHGVLFHSDATQAVGKIPTHPREMAYT
jgi:cysteine desulfurase